MTVHTIVLIVLICIIAYLVFTILRLRKGGYTQLANRMARKSRESLEVLKPCPLCNTMLHRGERIRTVVFSGDGRTKREEVLRPGQRTNRAGHVEDAITHMYGCPHCYGPGAHAGRRCPVCQESLEDHDYVVARLFVRQGRKHLHVLGCTRCRTGSRRLG
ncbi:MAG: hypothetical protein ACOCYG_00245 [Spirochaetota bacterium]